MLGYGQICFLIFIFNLCLARFSLLEFWALQEVYGVLQIKEFFFLLVLNLKANLIDGYVALNMCTTSSIRNGNHAVTLARLAAPRGSRSINLWSIRCQRDTCKLILWPFICNVDSLICQ